MIKWSNIFTIPDNDVISDGSVDPMGMQMIWTYFGQLIYNNKLTTVSTDVRNYTINLLHHYVLYRFQLERNNELTHSQGHFPFYRDEFEAKAGMIIFMEDLFVYSIMDQRDSLDTNGILGSNNATNKLESSNNDYGSIQIHAERTHGVLIRQIQLGVNGRYKGPFMNMGLMSKNFEYDPKEFERIDQLFNTWPTGLALVNKLMDLLTELLQDDNRDYPIVTLDRYKNDKDLWQMYADCFGSKKLTNHIQEYWLDKLGITQGAAKSIYNEVKYYEEKSLPVIIASAFENEKDAKEKELLQWVLDLEPFLSRCSHAFFLLADVSCKRISDLKEDLDSLVANIPLDNVKPLLIRNERLALLVDMVKDATHSGEAFGEAILLYHKSIMEDRGGVAWVELENDNLKHYIPQKTNVSTAEVVAGGYWYNRYYLDAVNSIYKGLNLN